MRILWFNWRDTKNPDAGGAEVFTHEVMRRLVTKGYDTTLFAAEFPGCSPTENIDGVKVVRNGSKYKVYSKAAQYYRIHQDEYDLVIDEINTKPFLTTKFIRNKPIIALFHQMAREFWFYETSFPLNYVGYYYLEKKWLSNYKNIPTITVSNSSKKDLEELGFQKIYVVPEGLNIKPLPEVLQKETEPTVIFTGRMKKAKLPHHAVEAFSIIKKEIPEAKMWVIGDGYMLDKLKQMNEKDVTFFGHINSELKYKLMSKAHLALVPAVREGWGLVVTESNAMGTPAVAYNVPGLRDSVQDGHTGVLVSHNSPEYLAKAAIELLRDRERLAKLSNEALKSSRNFSWDNTAEAFDKIIKSVFQNHDSGVTR
jgi:glycosyltransferase involved in cell wall biosynthesis